MWIKKTVIMWSMALLAGAAVAEAAVDVAVAVEVFGKYVWRGQEVNKSPVLQLGAG